ncbi:hypothetical protein M5K25_004323 [Dendrobium thyrsiflorum]|uniref:Uncharacterized protein n=1 Tax=Dendrobium thyrsiflorum TaxID=117978 RepID=A0ABD0VT61_DENTH
MVRAKKAGPGPVEKCGKAWIASRVVQGRRSNGDPFGDPQISGDHGGTDSAMAFSGPSVTFCFGSDSRVTLPESLLSSLPAGGITFGSFTDSAYVTLGGPTPSEAAAFSPPQRRGRAAMHPFGRPVARQPARAAARPLPVRAQPVRPVARQPVPRPLPVQPVRPVVRRPTPIVPVVRPAPAPQRRQPVVPLAVVPVEATRARVSPPPSSSRKRGAQAELPSPSSRRVSVFARLSHSEIVRQTPATPAVAPVPPVQSVGPDVASSSTSGLGRRARRNRNRRLRLAASEAAVQQMVISVAQQEPFQRRVVPSQREPRRPTVVRTPDVVVAPEIDAVQGGHFSPLVHSGDEEDAGRIAAAPPRQSVRQSYQWRREQPPRQPTRPVVTARPLTDAPSVGRRPRRHGRRPPSEPVRSQLGSVVVVPPPQPDVPSTSRRSRWVWRRRQVDQPVETEQTVGTVRRVDTVVPSVAAAVPMICDRAVDDEFVPSVSPPVRVESAGVSDQHGASSPMGPHIDALCQTFSEDDWLGEESEEDVPVHRVCVVTRRGTSDEHRDVDDDIEEQGEADVPSTSAQGGPPRSVDTDATVLQLQAQMAEMARAMATMTAQLTALGVAPQVMEVGTPTTSRDEPVVPPVVVPDPVRVERVQRTVPTVTFSTPVQTQSVQMSPGQIQDMITQKVEQAISSRKPQRQEFSGAPPPPRKADVHSTFEVQDKGKRPMVSSAPQRPPPPRPQVLPRPQLPPQAPAQPSGQFQPRPPVQQFRRPYRTPESQQSLQEKLNKEYPFKRESIRKIFKFLIKKNILAFPINHKVDEKEQTEHPLYCPFHRHIGHVLEDCFVFKDRVESLMASGEIHLQDSDLMQPQAKIPVSVSRAPFSSGGSGGLHSLTRQRSVPVLVVSPRRMRQVIVECSLPLRITSVIVECSCPPRIILADAPGDRGVFLSSLYHFGDRRVFLSSSYHLGGCARVFCPRRFTTVVVEYSCPRRITTVIVECSCPRRITTVIVECSCPRRITSVIVECSCPRRITAVIVECSFPPRITAVIVECSFPPRITSVIVECSCPRRITTVIVECSCPRRITTVIVECSCPRRITAVIVECSCPRRITAVIVECSFPPRITAVIVECSFPPRITSVIVECSVLVVSLRWSSSVLVLVVSLRKRCNP